MKSKIILFILLILFVSTTIVYNNFYTKKMVSGTYTYNFPTYIVDGPKTGDILNLKENGTFESNTWGKGTFTINGSNLELNYNDNFGKSSFECGIYRPLFFGEPRISICSDLDYYFKKE